MQNNYDEYHLISLLSDAMDPKYTVEMAHKNNVSFNAAVNLVNKQVVNLMESLQKYHAHLNVLSVMDRRKPEEDEPSIFGSGEFPSADWCLWHAYRYKTGIVQAHSVGIEVIKILTTEWPRVVLHGSEIPKLTVVSSEFKKAGIKRSTLSLSWVTFTKYYSKCTWEEAHANGIALMQARGEQNGNW